MLTRAPAMGADRLLADHRELVLGKRIALLTNHSGRLSDGGHIADAIHGLPGTRVAVLFGMHHDIRTNDYAIPRDPETTVDGPTGAPKHDLYASVHQPTPAMLADSDLVVVDVQDAGARFYEHINVMGFVLEAAADAGLPVVILDRPNPIAPIAPDGFLPDPACRYRFGSYGPIPITHGMTMGELARFYVGEGLLRSTRPLALQVVPMTGWSRSMWFDEVGPFHPPSPNLLRMSSLIGYPGLGLFEATALSEGRGTDHPFEQIGAPWLDAELVADRCTGLDLPGVAFDAVRFTPRRQPFHGSPPRFADESIPGVRVRVSDPTVAMPVRTGLALWWAIRTVHPTTFRVDPETQLRLMATERVAALLEAGAGPHDLVDAWGSEVARFMERRAGYLMYD